MKINNVFYRRVGDYNIPNLTLPPEEANITLGKWGMLHKAYLHKYKKVLFTTLLTQGELYQHCAEKSVHHNKCSVRCNYYGVGVSSYEFINVLVTVKIYDFGHRRGLS